MKKISQLIAIQLVRNKKVEIGKTIFALRGKPFSQEKISQQAYVMLRGKLQVVGSIFIVSDVFDMLSKHRNLKLESIFGYGTLERQQVSGRTKN